MEPAGYQQERRYHEGDEDIHFRPQWSPQVIGGIAPAFRRRGRPSRSCRNGARRYRRERPGV